MNNGRRREDFSPALLFYHERKSAIEQTKLLFACFFLYNGT
ncbi:hypothetical protein RV08_GL002948 [Enterococcus mundtii]|nr:hypothetical protein RV08_GL002948 [Enterococcus mundtii]